MPRYVSAKYLAPILGLSVPTIISLGDRGVFPAVRLSSRTIRFDYDGVMDALRKATTAPQEVFSAPAEKEGKP